MAEFSVFKMFLKSFYALGLLWCVQSAMIDSLISKANIYYQRPIKLGEPREIPLQQIKSLASKQSVKLIIHGFVSSRRHVSIVPLSNAYLAQGYDNILLADWELAAALDYATSRDAVAKVALHFGKLLETFLQKYNISHAAVHVLGHSLGAHIAGGIGRYFNGALARVTGLDPALPLFTPVAVDGLHAHDAQFVDVIHTDYPVFGDITPRGTADFYPGFGYTPQPGCDDINLLSVSKLILEALSCSHNRAVMYYAESIGLPKNFPSIPCSLDNIKKRGIGVCTQKSGAVNKTHMIYMGEAVSKTARGSFYLNIYETAPFGMGANPQF